MHVNWRLRCGRRPAYSQRIQTKSSPTEYVPTVFGWFAAPVSVRKVPYTLDVLDTCAGLGDPESDRLRPLTYPQTDVFIVCFSVGMPDSLSNVKEKWIPEVEHHCPGVPCVIAATQIDLRPPEPKFKWFKFGFPWREKSVTSPAQQPQEDRGITTTQGKKLARKLNAAGHVECSAKTLEGVKAVFDAVVIAAVEYQQRDMLLTHRRGRKF
ncbi:cell division control protein [Mycena sanguinolenta]|nr:cell division control protein [Mycena sanguinolenta]